ncbi:hypothetical protein CEXT_209461 [Caerostris extrusa]|uniref:Uncharacterized protein n=1 Tax=Caerostris extrusa TaxID=172846 RepID=A0AAV4MI22_CAEEX|nr:hypothetical protein CEXT_209461 [Caerostris extrusa]
MEVDAAAGCMLCPGGGGGVCDGPTVGQQRGGGALKEDGKFFPKLLSTSSTSSASESGFRRSPETRIVNLKSALSRPEDVDRKNVVIRLNGCEQRLK